mgnify:CR=1 FL=1|jgi:hypothetical protein|tara:strand:- start:304 stop:1107 length:804 start_codon:yes stop_codon:yes gene_type:complete
MVNTDDVFNDFEQKVEGKHKDVENPKKEISEDELLKRKHQEQKQVLKEKQKEEMRAIEERKKKHLPKEEKLKSFATTERIAFLAIILVLIAYIVIDLSFYHGDKNSLSEDSITVSVVGEVNESVEAEEVKATAEEKETVEEVIEEKEYSGVVKFTISKVHTSVSEDQDDLGYIERITFVIENDQDKVLTPVVKAYIYDSEMDELWETKSRGIYTFPGGITAGSTHTGTITISPKSFIDLDIKKDIRLTLNDTKSGFIKGVNQKVAIS